jgi:hypothetical protein
LNIGDGAEGEIAGENPDGAEEPGPLTLKPAGAVADEPGGPGGTGEPGPVTLKPAGAVADEPGGPAGGGGAPGGLRPGVVVKKPAERAAVLDVVGLAPAGTPPPAVAPPEPPDTAGLTPAGNPPPEPPDTAGLTPAGNPPPEPPDTAGLIPASAPPAPPTEPP